MLRQPKNRFASKLNQKQHLKRRRSSQRLLETLEARQLLAVVALDNSAVIETNPPQTTPPVSIDVTANDNRVPWEAGNIELVQNNTGNATGATTLRLPQHTDNFFLRDTAHGETREDDRGDVDITIGTEAEGDFQEGLLLTSISQTLVDHGQGDGPQSGISSSSVGGDQQYFVSMAEQSGAEYNSNFNAVHLPWNYPGIVLGATTNENEFGDGANNNSALITIKSNSFPPMQIGSSFDETDTTFIDDTGNSGQYQFRIPNGQGGFYDSNNDGILLVTGLKNDDNYAIASPNADGTYSVVFQDITTPNFENDGIGFAFIPNDSPLVTAGRVAGDATVLNDTAGSFTTTDLGNGQIRLEIDGGSPTQGSLIAKPEGALGDLMDNNIINFDPDGDSWIVSSLDISDDPAVLESVGSDPMFTFSYFPHDAEITDPVEVQSVNTTSSSGAVAIEAGNTSVNYTPDAGLTIPVGETVVDRFSYTVVNPNNTSETDTAIVYVQLTNPNDAPVAIGTIDPINVQEDAADVDLDLSSLFDDADLTAGDMLGYDLQTPSPEMVSGTLNGTTMTLSFGTHQNGTADVSLVAIDSFGETVSIDFTVTVAAVQDDVEGTEDEAVTTRDVSLNLPVLDNDIHPDTLGTASVTPYEAGNIQAVESNTSNSGVAVTVPQGEATLGFQLRSGSNRGDYTIQIGTSAGDDAAGGVALSSISQNSVDHDQGQGVQTGTSQTAVGSGSYFLPLHESPSGGEYNSNLSSTYFPFAEGWDAGHFFNTNDGGPTSSFNSNRDLTLQAPSFSFQEGVAGYTGVVDGTLAPATQQFDDDADFLDGGGALTQGVFRFDNIIGSDTGQIPTGTQINHARLVITTNTVGNAPSGGPFNVHELLIPFEETSTWDDPFGGNGPDEASGSVGPSLFEFNGLDSGAVVSANVTSAVQSWLDGTTANNGFSINSNTTNGWNIWFSEAAEAGFRPKLEVYLDTPPAPDEIADHFDGSIDLNLAGIDSQADGVLLVNGGSNEGNFALSRANADGSWTLFTKDNGSDGANYEADPVAYAYIPNGTPDVVSGRFEGDGDVQLSSGSFTITPQATGEYLLEIPGFTPADGSLIVSAAGGEANNIDNFVTYEPSGDGWLIQSHDVGDDALEGVGDEAAASFAFFPFGDDLMINIESAGSAANGPNSSELGASLAIQADGTVDYDPTASATLQALDDGESTVDTFTYTIRDGRGSTDTVTVTVTVFGSSVIAGNDTGTTRSGSTVVIGALANDTDFNSPAPAQAVAAANVEEEAGVFSVPQSTPDRPFTIGESVNGKVRLEIDNQPVSIFDGLSIASIRQNGSGDEENFRLVVSAPVGSTQWLEMDRFGSNSPSNSDLGVAFFPYTDSPAADFTFSQGREIAPGVTYNGVLDGVITGDGTSFFSGPEEEVFLDGNGNEGQALYRFDDIFGSGPGQIPFGTQIHSARFSVVTSSVGNAQSPGPFNLHEILVPWDDTATQTSLPFFDENATDPVQGLVGEIGPEIGSFSALAQGTIAVSNVTETVQGWLDGNDNNGFGITAGTTNGWSPFLSEAGIGLRPQLEIFVEEPVLSDPTWSAGTITSDGTLLAGDPRVVTTELQNGNFHVQIPGVNNSREQGLLFAIGNDNNDDNVASATAVGGNAWEIIQRDNTTDTFSAGEDGSMGFVYLPWNTANLTAGRIDASQLPASATAPVPLHQSAGDFSLTRDGEGIYRLSIEGVTPDDGALLLSPADYEVGTGQRSFLSYQADGDDFLIQNHEQPTTDLIDSDFAFAFVPFTETIRPGSDILSINQIEGNSVSPGSSVTIGSGAQVTLNADGSFSYDPSGQFDSLAYGQTATDTFTYAVTDGVAPSTASVTVTIVGERTELEVTDALPDITTTQDAADMVIDISGVFSDPEGNELELSLDVANSQYVSATLDETAQTITLDFNHRRDGIGFVSLTATDNLGREISDGFKVVVNPETVTRPLIEDEMASTDEATPILGIDVLSNDTEKQTAPAAYGSRIDGNRNVTNADGAWQLVGTSTAPYNVDLLVDDNNGDPVIGLNVVRDPDDGSIISSEEFDLANGYNMGVYRGDINDPAPVATVEGWSGFGRVGYATNQGAGGGSEINVPVGGAWFPADNGFASGHFAPSFNTFEENGIRSEYISIRDSGYFEVNLPFVNDSTSDGYLFATGINNGDNVLSVAPQGGTTWQVKQFDNDTSILGSVNGRKQGEDSDFSLMYIPADYPGLIAGRVDNDGNVLQQSGTFNISSDNSGEWELDIPGEGPSSGILIATAVGSDPIDGEPIAATAYYQEEFNPGGDRFVLNADFVDSSFAYEASRGAEIQFAFIPFVDETELATINVTDAVSAAGANVTVNGDGTLDYDPNGQFDDLGQGETATDTVTYTVANGQGSSYTGEVTVTITGIGDVVPFQVSQLLSTPSGFNAHFTKPADLTTLNLYDGPDAPVEAPDLLVTDPSGSNVPGSITWNAESNTLNFIATGGVLSDGQYDVTFTSGAEAFVDTTGQLLDGNLDGTAGDDFTSSFSVGNGSSAIVHLPDFARGAGQTVNVPATGTGLPLTLDGAASVTEFSFDLAYDPALLDITAAGAGADLPGDWTVTVDTTTTPGVAIITGSGSAISGSGLEVVSLEASVPTEAPYGTSQLLDLHNLSLNSGGLTVLGDDALHKAVFKGDADGDAFLTGADSTALAQLSVFIGNGFDPHDWTDPLIIGDVDSDGVATGVDATWIAQKSVFLDRPEIPNVPFTSVTPATGDIDPIILIEENIPGVPGSTVAVPLFLDIEPEAEGIINGTTLFVAYDPAIVSIANPDIAQSDGTNPEVDAAHSWTTDNGWTLTANVSPLTPIGQAVAITFSRGGDLITSETGLNHLVDLTFTVDAAAPDGTTPLDAEPANPNLLGLVWTSDDGSILIDTAQPQELFINEVLRNAPGGDGDREYIEIRGVPDSTIADGTYFLSIDGDGGAAGVLDQVFDLSGMQIGSNGYMVLLQEGSIYAGSAAAGANVVTATGDSWGTDFSSRNNDLENGSNSYLLIETFTPPTPEADLDTDKDGTLEVTGWTVLDSVGILDGGTSDVAYGAINFTSDSNGVASGMVVDTGYTAEYVARIDDSTGSATTAWVAAQLTGTEPDWILEEGNTSPASLDNAPLDHLGATNAFVVAVNAPPVLTPAADQDLLEGGSLTDFTVGTFTDADSGGSQTATIDWGDGSAVDIGTVDQSAGTIVGSHTFADDGVFTVTVSVDDGTNSDEESFTVTVDNVAPTVEAGANQSVNTGGTVSLDPAMFTDPSDDTHTATIDWGDGSTPVTGTVDQSADSVSGSFTYSTAGTYTVTVTVDDGVDSSTDTFTVTVADVVNNPPAVTASADQNLDEGDSLTSFNVATFTDGDSTAHSATIDWGDGTAIVSGTVNQSADSITGSHTFSNDGTFTVTVAIDDGDGNQATDTFTVTVNNVAPTAQITGPTSGVVNQSLSFTFSATDPSLVDATKLTYEIDWDNDGTIDITQAGTSAGITLSNTFSSIGTATVAVTVTDPEGDFGTDTHNVTLLGSSEPVVVIDGDLIVTGTGSSDRLVLTTAGAPGLINVRYNRTTYGPFSVSGSAFVFGLGGNDTIITNTGVPAVVEGGEGNDYIAASTLDDTISGGDGNDIILASEGDNFIDGGAGTDRLEGRSGNDIIFGGPGNDRLNGNAGDDILDGGEGNDFFFGGLGNDLIVGREGADVINGHYGNDVISGGASSDQLFGGGEQDLILGGLGLDRLRGDSGDDDLIGGTSQIDEDLETALDALLASLGNDLSAVDANVASAVDAWFTTGSDHSGFGSFDHSDGWDDLSGGSGVDQFTQADGIRDLRAGETYID